MDLFQKLNKNIFMLVFFIKTHQMFLLSILWMQISTPKFFLTNLYNSQSFVNELMVFRSIFLVLAASKLTGSVEITSPTCNGRPLIPPNLAGK